MIYDVNDKISLPELEEYKSDKTSGINRFWQVVISVFILLVIIPIIAFVFIIIGIYKVFRIFVREKDNQENSNLEDISEERTKLKVKQSYDEITGWMQIRMNHAAFERFVAAVEEIYEQKEGPFMGSLRGKIHVEKEGYHTHSGFFFPEITEEITLGTGNGKFVIEGGEYLWASPDVWQNALKKWREILIARSPSLIVLDKFQTEWCDTKSTGRFSIEYIPDMLQEANNQKEE